ncbi:MAG: glycosyltransferase [Ignavibacteriaceae bacterium]|jgi:cellulose synthase/poly-beta-1,6-N-acetylglucosamine synthase-like glycosyltransferase
MFEVIFLILISGYFIQSVIFVIGASRKYLRIKFEQLPTATVIVAARDESENILRCLKSLDNIEYDEDKIEIILVDDNSKDGTGKIIDKFIFDKPKFKKIVPKDASGTLKGKTNALANAINIAKGEIILTTDADCVVPPLWVKTITSYYREDVGAVNGYTTQLAYNSFSGMQAIDFIYLLTIAAGTINLNKPVSCIGNNMSYRKCAYIDTGGYENLPFSVTEDFNLLHAIQKLKKYKIIFPLDKEALITSIPFKKFERLFHQKKRWGIGGLQVSLTGSSIMAWGFATNLYILLTPLFFTAGCLYLAVFKLAIDYLVLYFVHKQLGIIKNLRYYLNFEIYFILYVLILPFIVAFSRNVTWKGREY